MRAELTDYIRSQRQQLNAFRRLCRTLFILCHKPRAIFVAKPIFHNLFSHIYIILNMQSKWVESVSASTRKGELYSGKYASYCICEIWIASYENVLNLTAASVATSSPLLSFRFPGSLSLRRWFKMCIISGTWRRMKKKNKLHID